MMAAHAMTRDEAFVLEAVELARRGVGHTRPNPPVGAVLVRDGVTIGRGWHRKAGGDHAEVAAIKDARRRGNDPAGAALYVTLEPCSRPGRVGACTDAIVAAKVARVVYGAVDPNPTNRGRAARVLARAGIACRRLGKGVAAEACADLIRAFARHVTTGLPLVTVKIALSLDGRICDTAGDARWISGATARRYTGRYRERVDAVLVGAETVRRDNPSLLSHGRANPDLWRAVVTRSGDLPPSAQLFTDAARGRTVVFCLGDAAACRKLASLAEGPDAIAAVVRVASLEAALAWLGSHVGALHVLCEGGLRLASALAEEGLVDDWLTVLAPVVIGSRPIARAVRGFRTESVVPLDDDRAILCRSLRRKAGLTANA